MLGDADNGGWEATYYEILGIAIFVVFTFMIVLLMLNLLIAIMGDAYSQVMESQPKEKMRERAMIIVETERAMSAEIDSMIDNHDPRLQVPT